VTDVDGYPRGYAYALDLTNWRQPSVLLAETYPADMTTRNTVFVWRNSITGSAAPQSVCEYNFSAVYYHGADCSGARYITASERLVPGVACFFSMPYPTHGESLGLVFPVTTGGGVPLDAVTYQSTGIGPYSPPSSGVCTNVTPGVLLNAIEVVKVGDFGLVIIGAPPTTVRGPLTLSP
jgi:hypothetical protein